MPPRARFALGEDLLEEVDALRLRRRDVAFARPVLVFQRLQQRGRQRRLLPEHAEHRLAQRQPLSGGDARCLLQHSEFLGLDA